MLPAPPRLPELKSAAQICMWILNYGLAAVETRQLDIVSFHNRSGGRWWNGAGQYSVVLLLLRFSFNPFYLETILSQMICYTSPLPAPPHPTPPLPHLEISSCLPMPHHYTTDRVGFRSPPADKAWKNARLFGPPRLSHGYRMSNSWMARLGMCSFPRT